MAEVSRLYPHQRERTQRAQRTQRTRLAQRGQGNQRGQAPEPLWREVLGSRLRGLRTARDETLAQTAERAGISPQYLSEIERGRKEPSSEMIAALAGALDTTLIDLTTAVAEDLRRAGAGAATARHTPPVALAMAA